MPGKQDFAGKTCVVTGANRGIGLALVTKLLAQQATVVAGVRNPAQADALKALEKTAQGRLVVLPLDVTDAASLQQFVAALPGGPVDLLINNAGVNLDGASAVSNVTAQVLLDTFACNTVGPLQLTQHLLEKLHARRGAKVANISSVMGSISDNQGGGVVAYRASKSALNMVTKCLAIADPSVVYLTMHPGWVQTRMGGEGAQVTTEASAQGLLQQIARATEANSGTFIRFDGVVAPW